MKVSISWLKQLVDLKIPVEKLVELLPLRTIGIKEVTEDFIELDMKGYNRADLLSMHGVALEVAAITDSQVKFTDQTNFIWQGQKLPEVKVEVQNQNLCPIYCIAKIENLKVEQSNDTWVKKLSDAGIRSVNNMTDITNLVMLEYGQPMHAFDSSQVKDETIMVRSAKPGEKMMTLDEKGRALETDLLIADPEKPLGLAGIMGGKNSEVTDVTNSILLEAAIFDPIQIRKTATRLGLQSEASKRFEHGLTKTNLLKALNTAIKMYQNLGGKLTAITLIGNFEEQPKVINLATEKVRSLIGVEIKDSEIEEYLKKLYFDLQKVKNGWTVIVPYWRLDIEIEEDLIEEVARMYGYEKIPAKSVPEQKPTQLEDPIFKLIADLKNKLVELGLTEVQTYSFYSTAVLENLNWGKENLVKVTNPISAETEYLRDNLWPNLLEVIAKNFRQGFKDMSIFKIGKVYEPVEDGQPTESYRLSLALYNSSDNPVSELYQIFQKISHLGGVILNSNKMGEDEKKYFQCGSASFAHPKRFSFLSKDGRTIGEIAEIHKRYTDNFGIKNSVASLPDSYGNRVAVLELELENLI